MKASSCYLLGTVLLVASSCQRTTDGPGPGAWQQLATSQPLADVQQLPFITPQAGWVVGGYYVPNQLGGSFSNYLLRTTDGGGTWATIDLAPANTTRGLRSFCAVSEQLLYGVADDLPLSLVRGAKARFVYRSADGGQSWQRLPSTGYFDGPVVFPTAQVGVAPYSSTIVRTTDGGSTWQPAWTAPGTEWVNAAQFPTPTTGFATGNCVLKTTDQGQTWQLLPWANGLIRRAQFLNASVGFALTESGIINIAGPSNLTTALYRTLDGGQSWQQLPSPASGPHAFLSANEFYRAGTSIEHTRDGGQNWQTEYTLPSGSTSPPDAFADITFPAAGTGYAVSRAGVVVKRQ